MATIEELLGASADDIEKLDTPEKLKTWLGEGPNSVLSLEPRSLPTPLGSKIKDEVEEDPDGCPIKIRKKRSKTPKEKLDLDAIEKEFE